MTPRTQQVRFSMPNNKQIANTGAYSTANLQSEYTTNPADFASAEKGGSQNQSPCQTRQRPMTAGEPRVTSAMLSSVQKKFGYAPRDILKEIRCDVRSFVNEGTLKEEHVKMLQRVDNLVELDKLELEARGETAYDCSDIKDQILKERELKILRESAPVKTGVFKKIPPRVVNPLET